MSRFALKRPWFIEIVVALLWQCRYRGCRSGGGAGAGHDRHGVDRGCPAGGGRRRRHGRELELDRQQSRAVLGNPVARVGDGRGCPSALFQRCDRHDACERGRHALHLRLARPREPARRNHAAVERRRRGNLGITAPIGVQTSFPTASTGPSADVTWDRCRRWANG